MSRPDLAALAAHWQEQLRLRDWRISISYVPETPDGSPAWSSLLVDNKTATIQIRDPASAPHNVEQAVLERVIGLHFAAFGSADAAALAAEHQAISAFVGAFQAVSAPRAAVVHATHVRAAHAPRVASLPPGATVEEAFAIKRLAAVFDCDPGIVARVRARMARGEPTGLTTPAYVAAVRAARTRPRS